MSDNHTTEFLRGLSPHEVLYFHNAHETFVALKGDEWINEFRVETGGQLDIETTGQRIGIPLIEEMPVIRGKKVIAQAIIRGIGAEAGIEPRAVHLNPAWNPPERRLAYGHEIGHLFLEEAGIKHGDMGRDVHIERFCDYFGRQMAIPVGQLTNVGTVSPAAILELMNGFGVDHQTMIYQLMAVGKIPRRVFLDTGIGEVPNPVYANKIQRHCICLDCEVGLAHSSQDTIADSPVYDLTSLNLSDCTSNSECFLEIDRDALFVDVNKIYGRWSVYDDEAYMKDRQRMALVRKELETGGFPITGRGTVKLNLL